MKKKSEIKKIVFILFFLLILVYIQAQPLIINWQQCLGGSRGEGGSSLISTWNGYMLLCGTESMDGHVPPNHGNGDFWLIRTDTLGAILWSKTYGGSDMDLAQKIIKINDDGFILCGSSWSNDGNVNGNHGASDYWIVKVDSLGNLIWQRCFGGSFRDELNDLILTPDSGFLLTGGSMSIDGNITGNHGFFDCWMVKLDKEGNLQWEKSLGGTSADIGASIKQTNDGGYIVGASTHSNDGDVVGNLHGDQNWEAWIIKLDNHGNIEWQRCYGGTLSDGPNEISLTSDGGYLFAGGTDSNDGDVTGNHGENDIWVVKLDSLGNLQWQKCYGGSQDDNTNFIRESANGTFLVGGCTFSFDGDVTGNHSYPTTYDAWLFRISPSGDLLWEQCIGGDFYDGFLDGIQTPGGEITLLGSSTTGNHSGDVQCEHHSPGWGDVWLVDVTDPTVVGLEAQPDKSVQVTIYPNPAVGLVNFSLSQTTPLETKISIINLYGALMDEFIIPAGRQEVSYSTAHLAPGFYTCILKNRQFTKSGKIVIAK